MNLNVTLTAASTARPRLGEEGKAGRYENRRTEKIRCSKKRDT
jgi:hypothetical protein